MACIEAAEVLRVVDLIMGQPLIWGASDCCTAACDVFLALHGVDPMAPLRGAYTTGSGAWRAIQSYGGHVAMTEALAAAAGLVPASDGEPGLIGLSHEGAAVGLGGRALLICIQPGEWACKTGNGFGLVGSAERAWRAA